MDCSTGPTAVEALIGLVAFFGVFGAIILADWWFNR